MNYSQFLSDKKTITACAFSVSQIGELVKDFNSELTNSYPFIPWNSIKGMRNRIVHDYDDVNLNMVCKFLTKELDEFKKQIYFVFSKN